MKKLFLYIIIFNAICLSVFADDGVLLIKPLQAYIFEPRIGSVYNLNDENLRLDIGASFDILRSDSGKSQFSFGADFFTYTRLRSEKNFTFPVETSDYFFGINFGGKFSVFDTDFQSRIRVAHISSHLVDGYSKDGVFFKKPFVFSREFFELLLAKEFNLSENLNNRTYVGSTVIFSTAPDDINNFIYRLGTEFNFHFNKEISYSLAADISNGEEYLNISLQSGFNFQFFKKYGIFLGYYYYSGSSIHGLFYKEYDNYSGIGFQIIYN